MPKYHIEVHKENTAFHYRVELHDSTRTEKTHGTYQPTRISYDWCNYKFMTKIIARKLLRKHLEKTGRYKL